MWCSVLFYYFVTYLIFLSSKVMSYQNPCEVPCNCRLEIAESISEGLEPSSHISTYHAWKFLIENAKNTIEIGSYAWKLRPYGFFQENSSTFKQGADIYNSLHEAGTKRKISIKIVRYDAGDSEDTDDLVREKAADVRNIHVDTFGIMHSKFILVDRKHFYLGSANFRAIAFTQNKEIGVVGENCFSLAQDLGKIFDIYWEAGGGRHLTSGRHMRWTDEYHTQYNKEHPMKCVFSGYNYKTFISSAPVSLTPVSRTTDLDSLLDVLDKAEHFISISMMDYFPLYIYENPKRYWPEIEDRLKRAAIDRKIKVKLLLGNKLQKLKLAVPFLKSLSMLNSALPDVNIKIKYYVVPKYKNETLLCDHCRLVHNKYVVTDQSFYIGTSNWAAEYMVYSAGVHLVVTPGQIEEEGRPNLRSQMDQIFKRDWNSLNAKPIEEFPII